MLSACASAVVQSTPGSSDRYGAAGKPRKGNANAIWIGARAMWPQSPSKGHNLGTPSIGANTVFYPRLSRDAKPGFGQ